MRCLAVLALVLAAFVSTARGDTNAVDRAKVDFAEEATLEVFAIPAVEHAEETTITVYTIPAVAHSDESQIEVDPVVPAKHMDAYPEWYNRIEAEMGSKAYWILYMAREKAVRGEDTEGLSNAFAQILSKWMTQ